MTQSHGISFKLIPWQGTRALEARMYCPKCGKSKVITGYTYPGWMALHVGQSKTVNCDHCPGRFSYRIQELGIEPI